MASDPLAHLRARLNAIGELMTRVAKDGQQVRPERHTASETSRRSSDPAESDRRPRAQKRESPKGMHQEMRLEGRRGGRTRKKD